MPYPDPNVIGHNYTDDSGVPWIWSPSTSSWVLSRKAFRFAHTFSIQGPIATATILGPAVPVPTGWTVKLISMKHRIGSGTNMSFKLTDDGADISAGFGTTASPITAVPADTVTDPADYAWTDLHRLSLVITAVTGAPTDCAVTAVFEITPTAS